MKNKLTAILATGVLSALVALAAEQPTPAPGTAPPGGAGAGRGQGPGSRGNFQGRGGFGMPLDEQQRQLFQDATQKNNEKLRALEVKLQAAQKELVEATLAASYDEKAVREKAEAVAAIQVDMMMLRSKALATVAPTLKPEQKTQLLESRFAIMMATGGGGMGGGPGGMRPGGPGAGFGAGGPPAGDRPPRDR